MNHSNHKYYNWKIEHYVSYLYLTIAFADEVFLKEEEELAKILLKKFIHKVYNKTNYDIDKILNEVKSNIVRQNLIQKNQTIIELSKKFILNDEIKMEVLGDLSDLIAVDNHLDILELESFNFIKNIFIGSISE